MKHLGLPRHVLLPLTLCSLAVLSGCSDDESTATPPVASPAATASGARCVTDPPAPDVPADSVPDVKGAYTVDGKDVAAPFRTPYEATAGDESAVLVTGGGKLTTRDSSVTKKGDTSSLDASAGQGLNAALLAREGGQLALSGGWFSTEGKGASAVSAAGEGARADLSASGISAKGTSAHGVMASYGAELALAYVEIDTAGAQAAPVATGPGGGRVTVHGGTMTSAGCGSPGVQTTGDVSVTGTLFDLANSEAFTVEPGGSLSLKDVRASAAAGGVVLRGDGAASFAMSGGSVQAAEGDLFSVQQATADVKLTGGAELTTKGGVLLRVRDEGAATFSADDEKLKGDVLVPDGSAVLDLSGSTTLDGTVTGASMKLGAGTKWSVAGDSTLRGLELGPGVDVADAIDGNGHKVTYDEESSPGLGGKTYRLSGGGTLKPA
ncbi:hypothetical protein AB0J38_03975 [Streptomyces sp. NPDC050095]|uniref:hypothetical protein n=1 Tax=unclassified Streptomyces TaxID=2593676 RepID=UPI0034248094